MEDSRDFRRSEEAEEPHKPRPTCCSKKNDTKRNLATDTSTESTIANNQVPDLGHHFTTINLTDHDLLNTKTGTNGTDHEKSEQLIKEEQRTDRSESQTSNPSLEDESTPKVTGCQCDDMSTRRNLTDNPKAGIRVEGSKKACLACIKGHRSSTCKHLDKPVFDTNKSGRPSGVRKRKVPGRNPKCDCPGKTCACAGNCNCKPKCFCSKLGYIVIYVLGPDEPEGTEPSFNEDMKGTFQVQTQTWTDSEGKRITEEEKTLRDAIKAELARRENQNGLLTPSTPALTVQNMSPATFATQEYMPHTPVTFSTQEHVSPLPATFPPPTAYVPELPVLQEYGYNTGFDNYGNGTTFYQGTLESQFSPPALPAPPTFHALPVLPASCCNHQAAFVQNQVQATTRGCNCGDSCGCFACPQHPWNQRTQDTVNSHSMSHFQQNAATGAFDHGTGPSGLTGSCMGRSQMTYAPGDSFQAARLGAAQNAGRGTQFIMMAPIEEDYHCRAPVMYEHDEGAGTWNYVQAAQQPFQQQVPVEQLAPVESQGDGSGFEPDLVAPGFEPNFDDWIQNGDYSGLEIQG